MTSELNSPDETRRLAQALLEAVRDLNHVTTGPPGLEAPDDVYDVLGLLKAGAGGLDQTLDQLTRFLERGLHADRLAVDTAPYAGDPVAAVSVAGEHLDQARWHAERLARALESAQQAIGAVYTTAAGRPGGDGGEV